VAGVVTTRKKVAPVNINPLESSTENRFTEYVNLNGCFCIKIERKNWPDRLILMPNKIIFIEFKRRDRKGRTLEPRKGQLTIHKIIRALGFKVYVCDDFKQAIEIFKNESSNCV
jgi:hypothetical protein